ncbi:MAG: peptide chain release factor N(5)-glutamine methyltransferase [candidate division Zixibacteria bacterium]|nr:peptide chain release factor N(5)-glutamine methyltransferase [candidate division Zixibacteria bacterium]
MDEKEFHRLIKEAEKKLKKAGIDSAAAEVEIILEYLLEVERIDLYLHGARLIDNKIREQFDRIIDKRTTRYPLQYILGEMYFYGRKFMVTPEVMVPTPETELLCDLAINYIRNEGIGEPDILDVGTGSGVIAVTIACELPDSFVTALDISPGALTIAHKNAGEYEVASRIEFVESNAFTEVRADRKYELILSNPPYISDDEYKGLPPEVLADPKISLVSGPKGLDFIAMLVGRAPDFLKKKGRLMFEIGYNQADLVAEMTEKDSRYHSISIFKDLNDIDRVVILSI